MSMSVIFLLKFGMFDTKLITRHRLIEEKFMQTNMNLGTASHSSALEINKVLRNTYMLIRYDFSL